MGEYPELDEEPCICSELAPPGEYYNCPICDAEWWPEDEDTAQPDIPANPVVEGAGE